MVQRYNPDYVMHAARFAPFAREAEHGEFVKFSDYEALVSELASSRQINTQTLQVKLTMADTIKELTARVNALAVENATLKSGVGFFMYSPDAGFEQHKTQEDAINAALEMIDDYRSDAGDGWCEEADRVFCGVILQQAVECDHQKPSEDNGYLGSMDYKLSPPIETPATDAALAAIQAQGVEKFAAQQEQLAADYRKLSPGCYGETSSAENALMARDFAAKLREAK